MQNYLMDIEAHKENLIVEIMQYKRMELKKITKSRRV